MPDDLSFFIKGYLTGHGEGPFTRKQIEVAMSAAANWQREKVTTYLKEYRRAYDESIFPPTDMERYCADCRTATAGRMGRFVLDNCIKEFER